jgi:Uma2 family endonuclease
MLKSRYGENGDNICCVKLNSSYSDANAMISETSETTVIKPISQLQLAPGSLVTIPNVTWAEFEAILIELGDRRAARIAYSHNTLEIMVPLPEHEIPRDLISDVIKVLFKVAKIRYQPFGSTTFKREGFTGVEPDACFYVQNYRQMIGRRRLQPNDPPPDLAIETDVTSKTAMEAYRAIGVPEVWVFDSGKLTIHQFQNSGVYKEIDRSSLFPDIDIQKLLPQVLARAWQVGSLQALEEFEAMLALPSDG